jgi:hypothetical protein
MPNRPESHIRVYNAEQWIEAHAVYAKSELVPFSLADVTPEMREPNLWVVAMPSRNTQSGFVAQGHGYDTVHRVVLADASKTSVIQASAQNSGIHDHIVPTAVTTFPMSDVEKVRNGPDREFFLAVVADNQNKYFKIKKRDFKALDLK